MRTAYYAEKIPQYWKDIKEGRRELVSFLHAQDIVRQVMQEYNIKVVSAHNARFDINALNTTIRYLTKSKKRFFFPYGVEIWDTLKMARQTIGKQKSYKAFCIRNGYMTKHKTPRPQVKAETIYRYISGNYDFKESHTGLEDVMIEKDILAYCFRKHKKMRKLLFEN